MNTIIFKVTGNRLTRVGGYDPVSGEKKYTEFRFEFDSEWNGVRSITVTMFFDVREPQNIVVDVENGVALCNIEEELRNKSGILWVGVSGYDTVSGATLDCYLTALPVGEGTKVTEVATTLLYQQIVELVGRIETKLPVSTLYIQDLAVTTAKLADGAVTGDKVKDNTLTPDNFDRAYWEKKVFTQVIDSYSGLFRSIVPINSGGSICIAKLNIITGKGLLSGYCEIVAVLEDTGTGMYITNLGDGSCWKIFKEKDKEVFSAFHNKDIRYLTKSYTNLGEVIEDFDTLFQKVGYISMGGTVGFVKILVSGSDKVTINSKEGYLSGEFLVVGSPTFTNKTIYLRNLLSGECWTVVDNGDGNYHATKIDSLTPRVEHLEKYSVINLGVISSVKQLNVTFKSEHLYRFSFSGELAEKVGAESDCLGTYGYENGPGGYLKFINLENGKSGVYWIDLGSYVENSGSGGADGEDGQDGYSPIANVTQTDSGATITITDKDGTTTATVVNGKDGTDGQNGYTPQKGIDYFDGVDGKDGSSVTINSITESTEDNGNNVVTFSNGDTLTIKNGSKGYKGDIGVQGEKGEQGIQGPVGPAGADGKDGYTPIKGVDYFDGEQGPQGEKGETGNTGATGPAGKDGADGYTPVKGVDYYTEEEKVEFEHYIDTELAKRGQLKPEFANDISECTDASKLYVLPDGFIYGYIKTAVSGIAYTNRLPLATDTDRKTVYNGKGFKENTRLSSSSGGASDATGIFATGFIPVKAGDVLYFKNMAWSNLSQKCYILAFNSSNAVTGKLEIQGSTASPAPTSPVTLDSATFGSGFNAIRISASDISDSTIITINQEIKESVVEGYGWASTGLAFVPADYEDRIIDLENEVEDLKGSNNNSVIPLVKFDYDHNLTDVSDMVSLFKVSSHDLRKQNTVPTVYSLFDELVAEHPDYISKVDAAELVGLTYPDYANGIATAGTYAVTPAYKTYMYKLSYSNAYSGNTNRHKHKKMLLIGGLDGSEYVPPYNLYILARRLCEDYLTDSNLFKLINSFDIYIVPCLNGYGLYHGTKYNANGIAITRNMPTKAWVEADAGDPNYYTGSVAGSEFETQLVMKLTQYLAPDVAIDHHSYGYLPTQFYSELPREDFVRLAYQSLVDCSLTFSKNLPEYFGTKFKLFQDREGATSAPAQVANVRGTQTWWNENGVAFGGLIEASVSINYLNGELAGEGQDLYGNDTFAVAEYTLRNQLLRYCEYVLNS